VKKYFLALVAALPLVGCDALSGLTGGQKPPLPAAGTVTQVPNYFPCTVGSTWKYKTYTSYLPDGDGGTYDGSFARTIVSSDIASDGVRVVFSQANYGKDDKETSASQDTHYIKADGVYRQTVASGASIKRWSLPLAPGEEVRGSISVNDLPPNSYVPSSTSSAAIIRVSKGDSVTSGTMSFHDTWRIDTQQTIVRRWDYDYGSPKIEESTESNSIWLAPNVGIVKERRLTEKRDTVTPKIIDISRTSFEISTYSIRP